MTGSRAAAALAAIVTALLLQATVVAPATFPWPVSLPAVLVAAVALVDGPGAGMSFGFVAGLTADLASRHPAGLLALSWLVLGLVCGRVAEQRSRRRDAALVAVAGAVQAAGTVLLLAIAHSALSVDVVITAARYLLPVAVVDLGLALVFVPVVRAALRTSSLRRPYDAPPTLISSAVTVRHD